MSLLLLCLWQMTSVLVSFLLTQFPEKSKALCLRYLWENYLLVRELSGLLMHGCKPSTTERQPSSATEQG